MKRRLFYLAVALVALGAAFLVWKQAFIAPVTHLDLTIVARVGGEPITKLEYTAEANYRLMRRFSHAGIVRGTDMALIRAEALNQLIDNRVMTIMAKVHNCVAVEDEVEEFLDRIYQVFGRSRNLNRTALARYMGYQTLEDFMRVVRINVQEIKLVECLAGDVGPASSQEIMDEIPMIHARQIFIHAPPMSADPRDVGRKAQIMEMMQQLRRRALAGEDFAELARQYSQEPLAAGGGDIGWIRKSEVEKDFAENAFGLQRGEISQVFETHQGFHLVKVINKVEPSDPDFDISFDVVTQFLTDKKQRERFINQFKLFRADMEDKGKIQIIDPLLRAYWYKERWRNAEALAAYEEAKRYHPEEAYIYVGIGDIYWEQRTYAEAEANYQQALRLQPNDAYIHLRLGRLYYEMGDRVNSLVYTQRASAMTRYDVGLHQFLEKFYFQIGEVDLAQQEHERMLDAQLALSGQSARLRTAVEGAEDYEFEDIGDPGSMLAPQVSSPGIE